MGDKEKGIGGKRVCLPIEREDIQLTDIDIDRIVMMLKKNKLK